MANDTSYCGWTNYETWYVHLLLTNDEGLYLAAQEAARGSSDPEESAAAVRHLVEELTEQPKVGIAADLIPLALDAIDWEEVASALSEE